MCLRQHGAFRFYSCFAVALGERNSETQKQLRNRSAASDPRLKRLPARLTTTQPANSNYTFSINNGATTLSARRSCGDAQASSTARRKQCHC
jgi:hypothetical protein